MSALIVLVLVSLLVAGSFLAAFIWSVDDDQYIDQEGAAMRILFEEDFQKKINNVKK
ncbi:MAG: cbb3-type cytochrome oxidase assembly protein CcoS [Flavipsychrobacter sp.]|nr:cbb3-type cytochrome oxidase assembly protein CcoS [Flavipsychrobacter sp.]